MRGVGDAEQRGGYEWKQACEGKGRAGGRLGCWRWAASGKRKQAGLGCFWDWVGLPLGFGLAGLGLVSGFLSFFPILFLFQTKLKPFEFKFDFEFKPHSIN